jgi:hypothetical protein
LRPSTCIYLPTAAEHWHWTKRTPMTIGPKRTPMNHWTKRTPIDHWTQTDPIDHWTKRIAEHTPNHELRHTR